ncbi:MAG: YdcF family protein [Vicinamibacteria bacterium]|nr:YdcF family protein [Vicinamibacteria bacterium]
MGRFERALIGILMGFAAAIFVEQLDLYALVSFWGDRRPFLAALILIVSLCCWTRLRKAVLIALAGLAIVWSLVVFTPICRPLASGLVLRDSPAKADVVFVFSSKMQKDGEPTSIALARLLHGVELIQQGAAPRLVLSTTAQAGPSYTLYAERLLKGLGIAGEIHSIGPTINSHDEALHLASFCKRQGFTRVIAVTSPTHSMRAAATLRKQGLQVLSSPALETGFDLERLDDLDDRLAAFGKILHERIGLLVYRYRGWLALPAARATSPG